MLQRIASDFILNCKQKIEAATGGILQKKLFLGIRKIHRETSVRGLQLY